ncbi:DUF2894 domain-containing protein [Dyella solisilvae]|uniref:DUF2894 domain-containing protein n=1 Tax=Dyella solisilvae TaxID=1920168 RepID=A0A370K8M2_9GAMM|nr:DUF2894 domain-containing protein [Dyella solisilvae]RDI98777.1 DUF2894 domain-containing protein [Dyella solisilvae]
MTDSATHARARLDAWREQGADRVDPLRFHVMEALERRAADHHGEARRLLDQRLSALLDAYEADLGRARRREPGIDCTAENGAEARGGLGTLVDHVAAGDADARLHAFAAPEALEGIRKLWAKLRTDSQMRQSLQQAPTNAGPLNSSALVHRAITLMREVSPGYLQHFLGYVDDLTWLEQMNVAAPPVAQDAPPAATTKKRAPRKPRKPQA